MKLTVQRPRYKDSITVEYKSDDMSVGEVVERLFRPAMLALGYHPESLNDVIGEIDDESLNASDITFTPIEDSIA